MGPLEMEAWCRAQLSSLMCGSGSAHLSNGLRKLEIRLPSGFRRQISIKATNLREPRKAAGRWLA